jgi:hypothetical protein
VAGLSGTKVFQIEASSEVAPPGADQAQGDAPGPWVTWGAAFDVVVSGLSAANRVATNQAMTTG